MSHMTPLVRSSQDSLSKANCVKTFTIKIKNVQLNILLILILKCKLVFLLRGSLMILSELGLSKTENKENNS